MFLFCNENSRFLIKWISNTIMSLVNRLNNASNCFSRDFFFVSNGSRPRATQTSYPATFQVLMARNINRAFFFSRCLVAEALPTAISQLHHSALPHGACISSLRGPSIKRKTTRKGEQNWLSLGFRFRAHGIRFRIRTVPLAFNLSGRIWREKHTSVSIGPRAWPSIVG